MVKTVAPPENVKDPEPLKEIGKKGKIQCVKAPKCKPENVDTLVPDVLPPGKIALIPELTGTFKRGNKPKRIIEIYSIDDVMRCKNPEIIGFLPVFKDSAI